MTWLPGIFIRKAGLLLALSAFVGGSSGFAGDAIVFGNQKTKVEPGKDKTPTQNPFRLDKMASPPPFEFDGITTPILPNSRPRKDKRQQNAEDERKNWLLLEKDELQQKDDEQSFMGIHGDDDLSGLDKSKDTHDYTFRDSQSSRTPQQLKAPNQAQSRAPSQRRKMEASQAAQKPEEEDTSDSKRTPRSSAIVFGSQPSGGGGDFDLKKLLDTKSSGRGLEKSDFSLRDLLGGSGETDWARDQRARNTESFKQLLGSSPSSGGLGDSFRSRPDFAQPSINPAMPMAEPLRRVSSVDSFQPRQSLGQPIAAPGFLTSPDGPAHNGALTPPSQPGGFRATPVEWPKPRF